MRRAIVRDLTEAYKELDAIEEKVRSSLAKRKNVSPRGPGVSVLPEPRGRAPKARGLIKSDCSFQSSTDYIRSTVVLASIAGINQLAD